MSLSAEKSQKLSAFLSTLPTGAALKLFSALEAEQFRGDESLPYKELLAQLRPSLLAHNAEFPQRQCDARRYFFTPLEDFFVTSRVSTKRSAIIARTSLGPIWRLMMRESALKEAATAAATLDATLRDGANSDSAGRALFLAAEAGLGRLIDAAAGDPELKARVVSALGSECAYSDMGEIRRLLAGVDYFRAMHELVPALSGSLSEEQLYALRTQFLSVYEHSPKLASFWLIAVKGRLSTPWRSLALYYHLARGIDDRLQAAQDAAAALPEHLLSDLEDHARSLESSDTDSFDAMAVAYQIEYFADYADGLAEQAATAGDNVILNRVDACREVAGEALERFGELALRAIRDALAFRESGGASRLRARRPDIHAAIDKSTADGAAGGASFIAAFPAYAKRLGWETDIAGAIANDARKLVTGYAKDLVVEIRAADDADRTAAMSKLDKILSFSEPLMDRDEIGLIRDRAAAAKVLA